MSKDLFGEEITEIKPIEREVLAEQLYSVLSGLSLEEFVSLMTNKFNEIIEYIRLTRGENTCQRTSLLFNPHRLDIKSINATGSMYSSLKDKSFISGLARFILCNDLNSNNLLYQSLRVGINGVVYIGEYHPYNARDILSKYRCHRDSKIIDPCAGWGGRMIGVSVVSNHYTCYEPSTQTYAGLLKLYDFIKLLNKDFNAVINCLPFEDADLPENYFDFALTSPPYYNTELYSDEETNSCNRYKTFDSWRDNFYLPMIKKTLSALKNGCTFALNIGSRKYPLNQILLDNFKDYFIQKDGNYFSGAGGLGKTGEGETLYFITKQ